MRRTGPLISFAWMPLLFVAGTSLAQTAVSDVFQVNTDPRMIYVARVAINDAGEFLVAWHGFNTYWQPDRMTYVPINRIGARRYLSSGMPQGDEFTVSEHFWINRYLGSVATNGSGRFLVSFATGDVAWGPEARAHVVACDSTGVLTALVNGTSYLRLPNYPYLEMGVSESGDFVLVWEEMFGGLFVQSFDATGAPISPAVGIGDDLSRHPDVAVDDTGNGAVVWGQCVGTGGVGCTDIYLQRFDSSMNLIGAPVVVNTSITADERGLPHIAMDGSGRAVVTWVENREIDNVERDRLKLRVYDSAGLPTGDEMVVDAFEGRIRGGAVALNAAGYAPILRSNGPGYDVVWDAKGDSVASTFHPDTTGTAVGGGDVAINDSGRFVVSWTHSYKVFARIFQLDSLVPVLFSAVNASVVSNAIAIEWSVAADESFRCFRLFRSVDGQSDDAIVVADNLAPQTRSFVDDSTVPGVNYRYTVAAVMTDGRLLRSPPVTAMVPVATLALEQNIPNPFHPATRIGFTLDRRSRVILAIFDVQGRLVRTLEEGPVGPGRSVRLWDGRDNHGAAVPSGVYFYRLTAGRQSLTRKMIVIR